MTREDAIQNILGWADAVAGEFCCSNEEVARVDAEVRESLRTLGVTDAEIEAV